MNKSTAIKWINALRSGKYKQTRHSLQDASGYCCLGVACDVFVPKTKLKLHQSTGEIAGNVPAEQPNAPVWLKLINTMFAHKTGKRLTGLNDGFYKGKSLADLNDTGYTFDEIADLIQAVYVEKVLD